MKKLYMSVVALSLFGMPAMAQETYENTKLWKHSVQIYQQ